MNLSELHTALRTSPGVVELAKTVATGFASRNLAPLTGVEEHARGIVPQDELAEQYAALVAEVEDLARRTDLADDSSIVGNQKYDGLVLALDFARIRSDGQSLNLDEFVRMAIASLLEDCMPGIDEYVERLDDVALLDQLGLAYDDNKLVDASVKGFDLRRHALVVSDSRMIYPHQFMRRFFSANFVRLPAMLRECVDDGLSVKLRIDPLRSSADPKHYQDIFEKDWWHGKPFNDSLLKSTDRKEHVTLHGSVGDQLHLSHPVSQTIFRTSMIDGTGGHERQFMIEEYTPLTNERFPTSGVPGFGAKYCIQRFGHFVYDQRNDTFNHLDGAVRVFGVDEYASIFGEIMSGKHPDSKIGDRHKLFLVEGEMSLERAQNLLYEFFMYNPPPG